MPYEINFDADETDATPEVETAGDDTTETKAPEKPAASADDIAAAVARAMKKPENEGKTKAEVKKDLLDELAEAETLDIDASYPKVIKHLREQFKAIKAENEAMRKQIGGVEARTGELSRNTGKAERISAAGGQENYEKARALAVERAHEIMGTDPKTYDFNTDDEDGDAWAKVANKQLAKAIAEIRAGGDTSTGKLAVKAAPAKGPTKPVSSTKTPQPSGNDPKSRMAALRAADISG